MFEPSETPRLFGLPLGADFPKALVDGINRRIKGKPPTALAQVELIVNTRRMARRIRDLYDQGPALLLPKIKLITDIGDLSDAAKIPPAVSPLRRRLELAQLVSGLLDQQSDLAPRSSLYDLSDSLAKLMDEMQGEGVSPDEIDRLDVVDESGHWQRAKTFISIVQRYFGDTSDAPDKEARQRKVIERLIHRWSVDPPQHPILIAGSTGSHGTTLMLMKAVAKLPNGAVILPGLDADMPRSVWNDLQDPLLSEDHPQYRHRKVAETLGVSIADVPAWHDDQIPSLARNRLISLSLRPAPVTHAWLTEGPDLGNLIAATNEMTLLLAPTPRTEALAIAMRLRKAAEDGQTAALITPDRMLTRQVSAALDRWDILPDDSAGTPLQLSPPGRFLRHVAGLFTHKLTSEAMLTLLKHPICHSGSLRNEHNLLTRDLELHLRKTGTPYPSKVDLLSWCDEKGSEIASRWGDWLARCFCDQVQSGDHDPATWVAQHQTLAETISCGSNAAESGELWKKKAGQKAAEIFAELHQHAGFGGQMSARDYTDLINALLAEGEVRDRDAPHPGIMIWGTLEARVQGADLVILAGLNEGSWPQAAAPDPWLNRSMRKKVGLLLPERQIGLSAHDYQQAVAGKEVWLSRSVRSDDSETVASRWVNRLTNLLDGLPAQGGPDSLAKMTERGNYWLSLAAQMEATAQSKAAERPSPRPPLAARPKGLSVTEIRTLIRDPYAIYAKHVLRLRPLDPLAPTADPRLRGIVVHRIFEQFIRSVINDADALSSVALQKIAAETLAKHAPWPSVQAMWLARIARVSDWFVQSEAQRQSSGQTIALEARGQAILPDKGFRLTGTADRIDRDQHGNIRLYDYKTGTPPSAKEQAAFDKQLMLEAAMVEMGGFEGIDPASVSEATYIGLGNVPQERPAPLDKKPVALVWQEFQQLINAYFDPNTGYTARRMMQRDTIAGDYDQLARFGEWDHTHDPAPEDLT